MNRLIALFCIVTMLIGAVIAPATSAADGNDTPFYYSTGITVRLHPTDEALAQLPEGRWRDRILDRIQVQGGVFTKAQIPAKYRDNPTEKGRVDWFAYETYIYSESGERGSMFMKECYVYLPYGYDPEGAYNILYLMPGNGEEAGFWLNQGVYANGGERNKKGNYFSLSLLDNVIAKDYCDPLIVVTTAMKPDTDDLYNDVGVLHYEFHNDLIPAVESRYATYAHGDVSREGLIASRDHRAYFGMSRSAVASWNSILRYCTDYFSYIGTSAGYGEYIEAIGERLMGEDAAYEIRYWYNGNAPGDGTNLSHWVCYLKLLELCPGRFREGAEFWLGANCVYLEKPGHEHYYAAWIVDLYNCLGVFFANLDE